ncbi:hypothetical protein [Kitasatospora purpeofusca]
MEPEQRAANNVRALDQHPDGLSGAGGGLTPAQTEIGVRWQAAAAA